MKKLTLFLFTLVLLMGSMVYAYEVTVQSASDDTVTLSIEGLNTVDVRLVGQVQATAVTSDLSDTYVVDAELERDGDTILVIVDISELDDYTDLSEILISGTLSVNGDEEEFAKRIAVRETENVRFQSPADEDVTNLYWTVGLAMLAVIGVLAFLVYNTPKTTRKPSVKRKAKSKKSSKKKKKVSKRKVKKKSKKKVKKKSKKKVKKKKKKAKRR